MLLLPPSLQRASPAALAVAGTSHPQAHAAPWAGRPAKGSATPSETYFHCSGSIFPASLLSSPAGMQPLLGEQNPPTMGPAAARDADFSLWMRKHLSLQGWGGDARRQQDPSYIPGSPCVPVATELCNQVFTWRSRGLSLVAG